MRLNRLFSENLSRPESRDAEQLRKEVADNVSVFLIVCGHMCECKNDDCNTEYRVCCSIQLNEVYKHIPGAQKVQKTTFR